MPDVGSGKQGRAHTGLHIPGPLSLYRGDARTMRAAVPSSLRASEGTLQTTGLRGSREPLDFVSRAGGGRRGGTQGRASSPAWSSAQGTRRRPCSGRPPRKRPEDAPFSPGPLRLVPVALSRADVPRRGEAQRLSRSLRLIPRATLQGCVERRAAWGSP